MHFRGLALVALAGVSLLASPAAAQVHGTITGVVRAASDSSPVAGATVRIDGASRMAITDRDGRYRLTAVQAGELALVAQRLGYREARMTTTISSGATVQANIVLVEAPAIVSAVTVTATRSNEEASRDLAVSVDAVGTEELKHMRPSHVAQPLNRIAGAHMTEFEGGGSYSSVRQPMCCRSTLLFMEDGIPFTSPAFYSPNYVGLVNFAQVAQIEVLKGPGTAAYGSDAVTGVINFVSAMAPLAPSANVALEGGPAGYRRVLASAGGTFDNHNVAMALNAAAADGRRQNPYSTLATSVRWFTPLRNGATIRTSVSVNNRDGTGADDQTLEQFRSRSRFNPYPVAFDNWRTVRASTNYRDDLGQTTWSVTPYLRYEDSDRVPGWQLSYDPVVWQITSRSAGVLSQLRHSFSDSWNTRITAGFDADFTPARRREPVITPVKRDNIWVDYSLDAAEPHYDYRMLYRGAAGYVQFDAEPIERLRVSAGGRLDASHYRYDNLLSTEQTGFFRRPPDTTRSYTGFSPKLGAVYAIGDQHRVFASYRRGFRVPIEQQLFKQGASTNTLDLQPVQVTSFELGFRSRVRDRISYELVGYAMHLDNDILSVRYPQGISTLTNNGRTIHRGLEFTASAALTSTLRFDVAVTQALHRFDRWQPEDTVDYSRNEMDAAPSSLRSALLAWQPRVLGGGQIELEYSGVGGYWIDGANTQRQDGYDLLHLRAGWIVGGRWEFYGRVMNITDVLYPAETFPGFGDVPRVMNPGEYRSVYAGVRASF